MGKKSGSDNELPVASWHRGLSFQQMKAADELAALLPYEIMRTRDCLLRLGVRPLVKNQQLMRIVRLSRAQNLAFLFFLYQDHYRSEGPRGHYTLNGQLLLSAIAYLDMSATFQALDKVLPLHGKEESKSQRTKVGSQQGDNWPLHLAKQLAHKSIERPSHMESSPPLVELQNDQTNGQQNDLQGTFQALDQILRSKSQRNTATPVSGRQSQTGGVRTSPYFQKQHRPKSDRLSTHYLANPPQFKVQLPNELEEKDEVDDRWFADFEFHPIQRTVKAAINYELRHLFDKIDEAPTDPQLESRKLCSFHQESRSQERQTFLIKQRQRYVEMIDIEAKEKRLTKERIINHLNHDVEEYLQKFGNKGLSPRVPVMRMNDCPACIEMVYVLPSSRSSDSAKNVLLLEGEGGPYEKIGATMRLCGGQEDKEPPLDHADIKYFKAHTLCRPYNMDYERIFEKGSQQSLDTHDAIANSIAKALKQHDDEDESAESGFRYLPRKMKKCHINKLISGCVRKIFEKSILVTQSQRSPRVSNDRLFYGNSTHFDPDDNKFMDQMLSDAFQLLRNDQQLVLVTLPDGHQVPEVREWIRRRYGKRYGPQTRKESDKMSENMMKIAKIKDNLGPLLGDIDPRTTRPTSVSYDFFDEIMAEANRFKKTFRDNFFQLILERTNKCWQTQHSERAYNSHGLRRTFFTYLPSSLRDAGPTISPYLATRQGQL